MLKYVFKLFEFVVVITQELFKFPLRHKIAVNIKIKILNIQKKISHVELS